MELCRKVLHIFKAHEKNKFQRFVTGDESWFTLEFHRSAKWSVSRYDVPQKVKQRIEAQKIILIVIWEIDGFHVVDLMTEQRSYNTQYFLSHILEPMLLAVVPDGRKPHSRRSGLHRDKCLVHRSKASENFSLKILSLEDTIRLTVLTWHLLILTSGFSGTRRR
jgi:hypothetical protein